MSVEWALRIQWKLILRKQEKVTFLPWEYWYIFTLCLIFLIIWGVQHITQSIVLIQGTRMRLLMTFGEVVVDFARKQQKRSSLLLIR